MDPLAGKPARSGTAQEHQQLETLSQEYSIEPLTLQEIESGGREVTVLFIDLCCYTRYVENRVPHEEFWAL